MNTESITLHATHKEITYVDLQTKILICINNYYYGYIKYNSLTHQYAITREWFPGPENWPFDEPGVTMTGSSASLNEALTLVKDQLQNKRITYNIETNNPTKISVYVNDQFWGLFIAKEKDLWVLQYTAFPKLQIWATEPENTGTTFICFEGTKVPGTAFKSFRPIEQFSGTWKEVKKQFEKQVKQNFNAEQNTITVPYRR